MVVAQGEGIDCARGPAKRRDHVVDTRGPLLAALKGRALSEHARPHRAVHWLCGQPRAVSPWRPAFTAPLNTASKVKAERRVATVAP